MAQNFASTGDTAEKKITFSEIGRDLYAFTAEGDPNSGVIVGDDGVIVIDAQATPVMANLVIERVRKVTDKPIKYVVLSHYHAVRVLGASAYKAQEILASETCRAMIAERGKEDWDSEFGRFPRLFRAAETIPGLTWPTVTFKQKMTLYLGKRRVELRHIGRAHTAGDIVAWVPDANVVFSGDIVEYKSACYCGDAHFTDWPGTLGRLDRVKADALVPGRGDALVGAGTVAEGIALTRDFLRDSYEPVKRGVARGALAEGVLRRGDGGDAAQVRRLADLRALPALQYRARLRRGPGHRHPAHLDGRARPRHVGGAAGIAAHEAESMPNPILIELTRGSLVESAHAGAVAVVRANGEVVASAGDIAAPVFPRSAIKPLQALPLLETGAADRFGFGAPEIAIASGSHSGTAAHVALVRSMLTRAGLPEAALGCGVA